MRCQTWSRRLCARGRDSPSLSFVRAVSKREAKRSTMPRSFFGPLLGVAVQAHFVGVGRDHLVHVHGLVRLRLERHGGIGIEAAVAFAADHQIAVAVVAQPSHTGVGGDTAVHHHQGADRRLQCFEHPGQRPVFPDVAGEDFRAAHEAAGIEHQAQGQQRAVAALLFRVPALRLRLVARLALEVGVGQVVERHRRLQVEQPHRAVEQMRLDRLAMLHQHVRGAVELHRTDGLEVDAEQLPETAALLQPAVRRALRGGRGQTPDDGAGGRAAQGAVDAQPGQQRRQVQLLERPQADLLHADAAGADQPQRVDIDRLHIGQSGGRRGRAAGDQLRRDPLRFLLHGRRTIGHQRRLTAQRIVDAGAQQRPVRLRNIEVATEVEEGALAHAAAEAFGVHEAMREVGLSVLSPPGLGAPNEHGAHHSGRTLFQASIPIRLWHYIRLWRNLILYNQQVAGLALPENRPNPQNDR